MVNEMVNEMVFESTEEIVVDERWKSEAAESLLVQLHSVKNFSTQKLLCSNPLEFRMRIAATRMENWRIRPKECPT